MSGLPRPVQPVAGAFPESSGEALLPHSGNAAPQSSSGVIVSPGMAHKHYSGKSWQPVPSAHSFHGRCKVVYIYMYI